MASKLGGTKERILELLAFGGMPKIGPNMRMFAEQTIPLAIVRIENESEVL